MTVSCRLSRTVRSVMAVTTLVAPSAYAQVPIGGYAANLPVPVSPAFAALDISPDKVTRPATPEQLASTLINGIDKNGVFQAGIAIDVAPFMAWGASHVTRQDYTRYRVVRFLSRIQTSVATAKAASDADSGTQLAVGSAFTLFDFGDPRADNRLATCIAVANRAALAAQIPVPPPLTDVNEDDFESQIEKIENDREKTFKNTCREDARKWLWNRSALTIGVAPTWLSASGSLKDLELNGASVWAAAAYGFEHVPGLSNTAQLIGFVEHRGSGASSTISKAHTAQMSSGTRFRVGGGATSFAVEAVRTTAKDVGKAAWSMTATGERKLTDDLWLTLSIGGKSRPGENGAQTFVLNTLSWRYAQK
jgi:hypothetical protein